MCLWAALLEVLIKINTLKSACRYYRCEELFLSFHYFVIWYETFWWLTVDRCNHRVWSITSIIIISFWAKVVWVLVDERDIISAPGIGIHIHIQQMTINMKILNRLCNLIQILPFLKLVICISSCTLEMKCSSLVSTEGGKHNNHSFLCIF